MILHVVDGSHPDPFSQVDAVNDVLADIEGTASIPRILVFNKADQADEATRERLAALQPDAFIVSAYTGEDWTSCVPRSKVCCRSRMCMSTLCCRIPLAP